MRTEKNISNSLKALMLTGAVFAAASVAQAQNDGIRHRTHNGGNTTVHELTYPSGKTYYNFEVYISPRNTDLEMITSSGQARSTGIEEGYFEVYVDKSELPVTSQSCRGDKLIVAMPWSGKDLKTPANRERYQLFNRIQRMVERGRGGRIKIVLEASPSVTKGLVTPVRSSSVRQLDLSSCKLYFRTRRGRVVDYAGRLKG